MHKTEDSNPHMHAICAILICMVDWNIFWNYIDPDDPGDIGFGLFTKAHFTWLLVLAVLIAAITILYYRGDGKRRDNIRKCIALFLLFIEIFKQCLNSLNGIPHGIYLPLEICSFAEYTILIDAMWPDLRLTKQLLAFAFLPSALMALVMPSATIYPAISFYAIHQLTMHAGIVAYIIARYSAGEIRPRYSGIWLSILIALILSIPVYWINMLFGQNYIYLAGPAENSVINLVWNLSGASGGIPYIIGLTVLVAIVMHITYGIYCLFDLKRRHQ